MTNKANETKEIKQAKSEKSELNQFTQAIENTMKEIACTHADIETKIIDGLKLAKTLDDMQTTNKTWYTKDLMEIACYKMNLSNIETLTMPNDLIYTVLNAIYIVGVKDFSISTDKKEKVFNFSVETKRPYGQYKERLEGYGLTFPEETNEEKQKANQDKQDAINEANAILQSMGLKTISIN